MSEYFHPSDTNVFTLINLPEVVKGALFSRYSRSEGSLKEILAKEFLEQGEANAEAFYDRVLGAYGDDSVAELGGAHVACEGISELVATEIANSRIGISILQKSTRYVDFGKSEHLYHQPDLKSPADKIYQEAITGLFATYNRLLPQVIANLTKTYPIEEQSLPAYSRAIKAKALDLVRGLLPVGTQTNLGLFGNGRAYEYLIIKLRATEYPEAHQLADRIKTALDGVIAPFVKRADAPRGLAYTSFLADAAIGIKSQSPAVLDKTEATDGIKLVWFDETATDRTISAILYADAKVPYSRVSEYVQSLDENTKRSLLDAYYADRTSRHQRPGRALETARYLFEIVADYGVYRDLHRHRICTQTEQVLGVDLGYELSHELMAMGGYVAIDYLHAIHNARNAYFALRELNEPVAAQYLLPMAFRIRWTIDIDLRSAVHLIELRSQPQGHIGYRKIAIAMANEIARVSPLLAGQLKFVDRTQSELGRMASELKLEGDK